MAGAEAYHRAKFHLDASNRMATIHQRYRQDTQTGHTDNGTIAYGEPFYKESPKNYERLSVPSVLIIFLQEKHQICGPIIG